MEVKGTSDAPAGIAVFGESTNFEGVRGVSHAGSHGGVVGYNVNDNSNSADPAGPGVYGESKGTGVWGKSTTWMGVAGFGKGAGVYGEGLEGGPGLIGKSTNWHGAYGETASTTGGAGVWGKHNSSGSGVVGVSQSGAGVYGESATGPGIVGKGTVAGRFEGNVEVTGDITLPNADCAEDFDISTAAKVDPGTVMVLGPEGSLIQSSQPYDKRVAGVISGAGDYKPGIVLDKQKTENNRQPVALLGKVFCKVDAQFGAIEIGDLLTTSPTVGHAMKASEPHRTAGAVIGKALRPHQNSCGLIPILISLQ